MRKAFAVVAVALACVVSAVSGDAKELDSCPFELTTAMNIDVDGAPNAYGPEGTATLDSLLNAHYLERLDQEIVGYLLDEDKEPVRQGANDPFPGYYISTTAFFDAANPDVRDPRRYLDARAINYVVRGDEAAKRGAEVGDFVAVYSKRTHRTAFAVVGDTGNPRGDEGSLHLVQELGYPAQDGRDGSVRRREIVVRFFPHSNPEQQFFFSQTELDAAARKLGLDASW